MSLWRLLGVMPLMLGTWLSPAGAASPADAYPERPIVIVVPWPACGFTDRLGRMVAEKLSAGLGVPVVVDNRPGASAGIGSEHVMRAAPDGYTLLLTSTDGTVKLLQGKGTDPVAQFTQLCMLASQPVTLSVGPKFKGASLAQFVEAAKAAPGAIAYASNGEGGATHYGMEYVEVRDPRCAWLEAVLTVHAADGVPVLPSAPPIMVADAECEFVRDGDGPWRMRWHRLVALFKGGVEVLVPPVEGR